MANGNGETIMKVWPILVVALGLAATYGSSQTQLNTLADEVETLKESDNKHNAKEAKDSTEVEVLKANQEAIKDDIEEIKEVQKDQDKKLDKILDEIRKE